VLPDKLGGVATNTANLVRATGREKFCHHAILVEQRHSADARFGGSLPVESQVCIQHELPKENLYSVLRRLARRIPPGGGVLVANDWLELAMLCRHPCRRTVIQVLHGDFEYYLDLAVKHDAVVDVFVACSRRIRDLLQERLPNRSSSILWIPHGVPKPQRTRTTSEGPLRLLYAGRLDNGQKRVFDLPQIDQVLREAGCTVQWTVVGAGPDEAELRRRWNRQVSWVGALSNEDTMALMADHDVFVLPSNAEGLPISLLEAMSVGLVPVASDVTSGVAEVVDPGKTGYRQAVGDVAAFAAAIAALDRNRGVLEELSLAARRRIESSFTIDRAARAYESLFENWESLRREKRRNTELHYGSRLDQPWLPNGLVRLIRAAR
jgi:glycosyltransferase involved in cell wall biosynthesis